MAGRFCVLLQHQQTHEEASYQQPFVVVFVTNLFPVFYLLTFFVPRSYFCSYVKDHITRTSGYLPSMTRFDW